GVLPADRQPVPARHPGQSCEGASAAERACTMTNKVLIIDYGMANLRSVQKAFEQVGCAAEISSDPNRIAECDKLVLPGVGAFRDAIARLNEAGLAGPIKEHIARGKKFLGICLGLELLFDVSYEDGEYRGLGVL